MKQKINVQSFRFHIHIQEENFHPSAFCRIAMKTSQRSLCVNRQTLIHTTQSAGWSAELTNQLAKEQI